MKTDVRGDVFDGIGMARSEEISACGGTDHDDNCIRNTSWAS